MRDSSAGFAATVASAAAAAGFRAIDCVLPPDTGPRPRSDAARGLCRHGDGQPHPAGPQRPEVLSSRRRDHEGRRGGDPLRLRGAD
nr:hypothetical protein [Methylobacterium sp. J-090]